MKLSQYLGIFLGAIYGILIRLLGGIETFSSLYNIYSITFIWITPIVISIIPILISSNELYKSRNKIFLYPVVAVFLFAALAMSAGLEDLLCVLIICFPFLLVAGSIGVLAGNIVKKRKVDKKLYSIVLLPLLLNPVENMFPNKKESFVIENTIVINQNYRTVWENVLAVPEIGDEDYQQGFFNYIGVPRPVRSVLREQAGQRLRVGYFSDSLILVESITHLEAYNSVHFQILLDKSTFRSTPTDQHLLKSKYFKFNDISYHLAALGESKSELRLRCEYQIDSKMNAYANFWASSIIHDFEVRLLQALKSKLESCSPQHEKGYTHICDNLYADSSGTLFLRSREQSHFETGEWVDVWIKTVYCDTCWTPTNDGWKDITELKDVVDVNTFHLLYYDSAFGGDVYEDSRYRYFHKWMADGGTITLIRK